MSCEPRSWGASSPLLLKHLPSVCLFQNMTTSQHQHSYCLGPTCHHLTWFTVLAFFLKVSQLTHCPFRHSSWKDPVKMWVTRSAPHPPTAPASFRGIHTIWSLIAFLISTCSTPAQLKHTWHISTLGHLCLLLPLLRYPHDFLTYFGHLPSCCLPRKPSLPFGEGKASCEWAASEQIGSPEAWVQGQDSLRLPKPLCLSQIYPWSFKLYEPIIHRPLPSPYLPPHFFFSPLVGLRWSFCLILLKESW